MSNLVEVANHSLNRTAALLRSCVPIVPAPNDAEHPLAYLLRVSAENELTNSALHKLLKQVPGASQAVVVSGPGTRVHSKLVTHANLLRVLPRSVCLACGKQGRSPSILTSSEYVIACPEHGEPYVSSCSRCGQSLSWHCSDPYRCACGASLLESSSAHPRREGVAVFMACFHDHHPQQVHASDETCLKSGWERVTQTLLVLGGGTESVDAFWDQLAQLVAMGPDLAGLRKLVPDVALLKGGTQALKWSFLRDLAQHRAAEVLDQLSAAVAELV